MCPVAVTFALIPTANYSSKELSYTTTLQLHSAMLRAGKKDKFEFSKNDSPLSNVPVITAND